MSTADIATIGLGVDTSGLKEGVTELDKLSAAGKRTEQSAQGLRGAFSGILNGFKEGVAGGMAEARAQIDRTSKILDETFQKRAEIAAEATKALGIRGEETIRTEIKQTEQAYRDLRDSGMATSNDLSRAKDAMKGKIKELREEMGAWNRDWHQVGENIKNAGSKMQMMGAKGMVASAPVFVIGKDMVETERALFALANTAGIAGDQAVAAVDRWNEALRVIADKTNQTKSQLQGALDLLVAGGMNPEDAIKFLEPLGNMATAKGAVIEDVAGAIFASYENLKMPIGDATKALDAMASAADAGRFEVKDMAANFAVMTTAASLAGMAGTDAAIQLAAAGTISRRAASDGSTAANNVRDFLMKLKAPDTAKYFSEFGVDITKEVKKGLESGDLIGYIGDLLTRMQKENPDVISNVFRDLQAKTFATKLVQDLEDYKKVRDAAMNAGGLVLQQKETIMKSTQEKLKESKVDFTNAIEQSKALQAALDGIKAAAQWASNNPEIFGTVATALIAIAGTSVALTVVGTALSAIGTTIAFMTSAAVVAALPVIATTLAAIAGTIAAWKVGTAIGEGINDLFNTFIKWATDGRILSLGDLIYENMHGEYGLITVINKIPEWVKDAWAATKAAGAELANMFREGFQVAIRKSIGLAEKMQEMVTVAKAKVREWYQIGADMIEGMWEGIKATVRKPLDAIKKLGEDLPDWARKLLDIKSPSRVFKDIGQNIGLGMAIGIDESRDEVEAAMQRLVAATGYMAEFEPMVNKPASTVPESFLWTSRTSAMAAPTDKQMEALRREAERLKDSLKDPLDEALDAFERYDILLQNNLITQKEYAAAVAKVTLELDKQNETRSKTSTTMSDEERRVQIAQRYMKGESLRSLAAEFNVSEDWVEKLVRKTVEADTVMGKFKLTVEDAFDALTGEFESFLSGGEFQFQSFVDTIIDGINRIASEMLSSLMQDNLRPVMQAGVDWAFNALSGLFMKDGAAMAGGKVQAFASGGILGPMGGLLEKPTFFPMASGGIGIGGEAGTEAVMPLKRTPSGELGVIAQGGGTNVVVNVVESPGNGGKTQERQEGNTRILDIMVEQIKSAVGADISRGGPIAASMERTYGLNRSAGAY